MILTDSSIWVRALAGREPESGQLTSLLNPVRIATHDLVRGELLMGDRGGRADFLSLYRLWPTAAVASHDEVEQLVCSRRLAGRGIGWIDAHLLASALLGQHRLWTADQRLAAVAAELGVGWHPA